MLAGWSSWNLGLSQWFGNHYLCSICRLCSFDNELFVMCGPWFSSDVDTDSVGFMYCANLYNCPCCNRAWSNRASCNGSGDGSGCNHDFNSIWSGVFNKRHGRHVSIRWWNCHVGVYSFRYIDGTNNAEYSNFTAVLR